MDAQKTVLKEVIVLRKLKDPSIIKLENAFIIDGNLIIVMEHASGGELKEYLKTKGKLSELEAHEIFCQMLEAINHCHALNVIHRDLKLENMLFADSTHTRIKLVDFGIAGLIQGSKGDKSKAGSLRYMAPEILSGRHTEARPSVDVWSMGCILFALVCGELPFKGTKASELIENIKKGFYRFPENCTVSINCENLIKRMLDLNYKKRISIKEMIKHPWVIDINSKPMEILSKPIKELLIENLKISSREAGRYSVVRKRKLYGNSRQNSFLPGLAKNHVSILRNESAPKGRVHAREAIYVRKNLPPLPKPLQARYINSLPKNANVGRQMASSFGRVGKIN